MKTKYHKNESKKTYQHSLTQISCGVSKCVCFAIGSITDAAHNQHYFYNHKTIAELIILNNIIILYDKIGCMYNILEHLNEQFRFVRLPAM